MRVAHIITRMILGGAQENTLLTCEGLSRDFGDDVLLVTGPALGPEGSLLERARSRGVPLRIIEPLRREVHPIRDWASYGQLCAVLREYRPDVVHTHSAKAGILGRAAAWSQGVPAVLHTVHGAPFHRFQNPLARAAIIACERWAARRCHALVSVADALTESLVAARVAPASKFTTVYSGMEVEPLLTAEPLRNATRRELGYTDEHLVVGKIARLFHLKGHTYVIQAAREIIRRRPEVRFLLVGDGLLRDRLERQVRSAGLKDHFQFTGLVPPERIPALLAAMDIVVHASLREGLARAIPQALLAGRPVVAYDVDGNREAVVPEQTGILLPAQCVGELSDAVLRLIGDPSLRVRLGEEGRRRSAAMFRHEEMTRRLRSLYKQVLAHT